MSELVELSVLLLSVIVGLASLCFLAIGAIVFWSARKAEARFLPVQAKILSKRLASDAVIDEDGPIGVSGPLIEYEYEVNGEPFRCNVVISGGQEKRSNHRWAKKILRQHDVGQAITAYYDRTNPSQAFLVKGDRGFVPYFLVGFGILGMTLSGVFASMAGYLIPCVVAVIVVAVAAVMWLTFQFRRARKRDVTDDS